MKVIPDAYYSNIYDIDYDYLKSKGFKNIIFDVDNTLIAYDNNFLDDKTRSLISRLKKDFNILVMSNRSGKRLDIISELGLDVIDNSKKPSKKAYRCIIDKYNRDECIFIGDQIATDIWGASRMNLKTILVDGFDSKKPMYVSIYKMVENMIKDKSFKRGQHFNNL